MSESANNAPVVLDIRGLTKKFPLEDGRFLTACDNISLRVYKGQTLGIIGESGCGKSTLVRTILQLHPATSGEVMYNGENLLEATGEKRRQNRRRIQMVFQDPTAAFNPKMKIKDILCEPLRNFGLIKGCDVDAKASELLRMVELPEDVHPWFVASQAHPEFKSRPNVPCPLFREFVRAAIAHHEGVDRRELTVVGVPVIPEG